MNLKTNPAVKSTILLLSLMGTAPLAQAIEPGVYFGVGTGQAEDEILNESAAGFKTFVGVNLTQLVGMEFSYVDLGSYANDALTQEGIAYDVMVYIPMNREIDLFGRAGVFNWEVEDATTIVTGTGSTYGLGVNIRLNPNASLRGEWQTFLDVDGGDVDYYTASLSFNF